MTIRVAFPCLLFVLAAFSVKAQPPTPPGANRNLVDRLAALEARVAELESGEITEEDLVGNYAATMFGINMLGSPLRNNVIIGVETATWVVRLDEGGTGSIGGSFGNQQLWEDSPWSHTFECATTAPAPPECEEFDSETLTWRVEDGRLIATFEDEQESGAFFIGAGGRVLIAAGSAGSDGNGWSVVHTMIRLPDE